MPGRVLELSEVVQNPELADTVKA